MRALQARLNAGDPVSAGTLEELVARHGSAVCHVVCETLTINTQWRGVSYREGGEDAALAAVSREEVMTAFCWRLWTSGRAPP